jgi:hypothetical protein
MKNANKISSSMILKSVKTNRKSCEHWFRLVRTKQKTKFGHLWMPPFEILHFCMPQAETNRGHHVLIDFCLFALFFTQLAAQKCRGQSVNLKKLKSPSIHSIDSNEIDFSDMHLINITTNNNNNNTTRKDSATSQS